jgi:hypothetical protein
MGTRRQLTEANTLPVPSKSRQARWEFVSMESSAMTMTRRETTEEELELIELRYRQALALMNLEALFAEGQLDCM